MTIEQVIDIMPDHRLVFDLPFQLPTGRVKVRLTVTPENDETISNNKSAFGCLQRFADPEKINGEKGSWVIAVLDKHDKNRR